MPALRSDYALVIVEKWPCRNVELKLFLTQSHRATKTQSVIGFMVTNLRFTGLSGCRVEVGGWVGISRCWGLTKFLND